MATTQIEGSLIENSGVKPVDIDIPALEQALNLENLSGVLQIAHGGTGVDTLDELRALLAMDGGRKFTLNIGDGASLSIDVNHGMVTEDVVISVFNSAQPKYQVYPDVRILDANTVRFEFDVAPSLNQYRVVIIG